MIRFLFLLCFSSCSYMFAFCFQSFPKWWQVYFCVTSAYLYKFVLVVHTRTLPISANFLFLWCQVPDKFPFGIIDGSPVSQNSTGAHQTTMAFHMSLSHPVAWNHLLHTDWTIAAFKANLTFLIQFNNLDSLMVLLIIILVILKTKQWIMLGKQYLLRSLSSEVCQFMRSF